LASSWHGLVGVACRVTAGHRVSGHRMAPRVGSGHGFLRAGPGWAVHGTAGPVKAGQGYLVARLGKAPLVESSQVVAGQDLARPSSWLGAVRLGMAWRRWSRLPQGMAGLG